MPWLGPRPTGRVQQVTPVFLPFRTQTPLCSVSDLPGQARAPGSRSEDISHWVWEARLRCTGTAQTLHCSEAESSASGMFWKAPRGAGGVWRGGGWEAVTGGDEVGEGREREGKGQRCSLESR